MSWNTKFRAADATAALEKLAATDAPPVMGAALRELLSACPHPESAEIPRHGDEVEKGPRLAGYEIEVSSTGHIDAGSFQAALSVQLVGPSKAK